MAPDNIFLQVCGSCNLDDVTCENCEFAKLLDGGVTWSEDKIYEKDEEYIRKNALLAFLNERRKGLTSGDSFVAGERKMLKEIIEKIKKL